MHDDTFKKLHGIVFLPVMLLFSLFFSCPGVCCCWCFYLCLGCKSQADELPFGLFHVAVGMFLRAENINNCSNGDLECKESGRTP